MEHDLHLINKYAHYSATYNPTGLLRDVACQNGEASDMKAIDVIDLTLLKQEIDEVFDFLYAYKRYRELNKKFSHKLAYDKEGFKLDDHVFQSLDEVEKAWNNRAFL